MRYPLRFLVPVALLFTGLLTAVAVAVTSQRLSNARTEQLVIELLTTIGNQAAADVAAGLRTLQPERTRGAIEHLKILRGLKLGVLVDDANTVRFSTRQAFLGTRFDVGSAPKLAQLLQDARASTTASFRFDGNTLYYANTIRDALPEYLGGGQADRVLLLQYDYTVLRAGQRVAATSDTLIIAAAILLLSALSWLFLRRTLLGRISQLVSASRSIGQGDLATAVPVGGQDEIAMLGAAMDRMRATLQDNAAREREITADLEKTRAEIETERRSLADRVEARTRDLTVANRELARAKESAEAASRAKSAFLATVSHEIRTPMNGVIGAIELLERSGIDDFRAPLLKTAQESASSLLLLLNDLLDMARIEAGRMEIVPAATSLQPMIDAVLANHAPVALAKKLRLHGSVDASVPANVVLDRLRVGQVLGNLVSNAVKFTQNGSVGLNVAAERLGADRYRLRFAVTDTGTGIPSEFMGNLFSPFEQGNADSSGRSVGSGLGLAICRGLATSMGGTVRLHCPPGGGTEAQLELVVSAAKVSEIDTVEEKCQPAASLNLMENRLDDEEPVRVLVVDDHPANRLLQVRQLEQLGISADSAVDGNDALLRLSASEFDVLITDCEMPLMDGFELARTLRESDGPNAGIPVVACTAHALPEVAERCRESGMSAVLTKPMRLHDLATVLRDLWPGRFIEPDDLPPEEAAAEVHTFDEQQLQLLSRGSEDRKRQLVDTFIKDVATAIADIRSAIDASGFVQCGVTAHRNKGACGLYGAERLGEVFASIESLSQQTSPDAEQLRRAVRRLETELRRVQASRSTAA